jgi:hypothetical protein
MAGKAVHRQTCAVLLFFAFSTVEVSANALDAYSGPIMIKVTDNVFRSWPFVHSYSKLDTSNNRISYK